MNKVISIIVITLMFQTVNAEPHVIYDSGTAIPTSKYEALLSGETMPDFRDTWIFKEMPGAIREVDKPPKEMFPITTSLLTPKITNINKEVYFSLMAFPICIVGADSLSIEWIKKNKRHLVKNSAHCMLVEAKDLESAQELMKVMKGILVFPADGDVIAKYFKIKHYPVFITERYISQ